MLSRFKVSVPPPELSETSNTPAHSWADVAARTETVYDEITGYTADHAEGPTSPPPCSGRHAATRWSSPPLHVAAPPRRRTRRGPWARAVAYLTRTLRPPASPPSPRCGSGRGCFSGRPFPPLAARLRRYLTCGRCLGAVACGVAVLLVLLVACLEAADPIQTADPIPQDDTEPPEIGIPKAADVAKKTSGARGEVQCQR